MRPTIASLLVAFVLLLALTACVDTPLVETEPQARLIVVWDPLACGEPHRVALELESDLGADLSTSVRCEIGSLSIDLPRWGLYRGRVFAWKLEPNADAVIRSIVSVHIEIDAPVVHWVVDTPR